MEELKVPIVQQSYKNRYKKHINFQMLYDVNLYYLHFLEGKGRRLRKQIEYFKQKLVEIQFTSPVWIIVA